jgi:hypothetical protein
MATNESGTRRVYVRLVAKKSKVPNTRSVTSAQKIIAE